MSFLTRLWRRLTRKKSVRHIYVTPEDRRLMRRLGIDDTNHKHLARFAVEVAKRSKP